MGQLTGTVTLENNPLPGATVTITSPNLQGSRTTDTDVNGNYDFSAIPVGRYTVKFEVEGMYTVTKVVNIGENQTGRADAEMTLRPIS